ncbi:hypothetical protein SAMN04487969_108138 [Paenibacillus algorifonticola]|uniref:Uncharacterized protein n=1 Tax=Paenibacillus algorifonticola TaxID=684063 RepID=A0A1I2E319_9BACL|nr:hypothetical protein [Paenibacillus algorifonticola]SFE86968.1 hypothetical protein SAMN04487969_108138 [Paenibacillus algorifonticola]
MLKVMAEVCFISENEGGMTKDVFSGLMASFNVNGELIMCKINLGEEVEKEVIPKGEKHIVNIELPYGEVYKDLILPNYVFNLNVGIRVIAKGIVLEVGHEAEK